MLRLKLKFCCLLFLHLLLLPSSLQCISPPYQIWNYFQAERFAWSATAACNSHFNLFSTLPRTPKKRERKKNIICYFNSSQSLLLLLLQLLWLLSHNLPRPDATLFGQLVSQLQSPRIALKMYRKLLSKPVQKQQSSSKRRKRSTREEGGGRRENRAVVVEVPPRFLL